MAACRLGRDPMKITVEVDGEPVEHEFHIEMDRLTFRELALLEARMGLDRFRETMTFDHGQQEYQRMLLYAQLVGPYGPLPDDLEFDAFDPSWGDLSDMPIDDDEEDEPDTVVELLMVLPDDTEIEGASDAVDPTQRTAING